MTLSHYTHRPPLPPKRGDASGKRERVAAGAPLPRVRSAGDQGLAALQGTRVASPHFRLARRRMAFESVRIGWGQALIEVGAPISAAGFVATLGFAAQGFSWLGNVYAFGCGFGLMAFMIGVGLRGPAQDRLDAELERAIAAAVADGDAEPAAAAMPVAA